MHIHTQDPATSDITALLEQHLADMRAISPPESKHALDIEGLRTPDISFWSVRDDNGSLMGCGALKQLDANHAEIKSMRTDPAHRRKGVAGALLARIINHAQAQGIARLSLETGAQSHFAPARALYERFGFIPCAPFADYSPDPNSVFMTRELQVV
ncbi:MAG: GNAT family N-acetyltransferase [Phycisphaerae bacterium]|nr:GNAT family N-acetyltransferase [Phycisphaerae bacterium]MBM92204.1 GNAT family N-acetyltransferase [Phycisphaerae bacterium]|tara:strand:- start:44 stop:511 length:468 start_codon:yes stop_codon:yes gene_type:complete